MFTLLRALLRLRLSLNESQWHLSQQPHAWLAPTPANGARRYLDACSAAGLLCLEQTPVLQPPRAPLYSRPGAGPVLLVPAIWSKPEGENFSKRADLKSAAMFPDAVCARASAPRDRPPEGNNARAPSESFWMSGWALLPNSIIQFIFLKSCFFFFFWWHCCFFFYFCFTH